MQGAEWVGGRRLTWVSWTASSTIELPEGCKIKEVNGYSRLFQEPAYLGWILASIPKALTGRLL